MNMNMNMITKEQMFLHRISKHMGTHVCPNVKILKAIFGFSLVSLACVIFLMTDSLDSPRAPQLARVLFFYLIINFELTTVTSPT